ncbi:MAG: hypothetical protein ABR568_18440 [Pyrinomonadaceae bacterium]
MIISVVVSMVATTYRCSAQPSIGFRQPAVPPDDDRRAKAATAPAMVAFSGGNTETLSTR